jgi:hypothetical protein
MSQYVLEGRGYLEVERKIAAARRGCVNFQDKAAYVVVESDYSQKSNNSKRGVVY